jgi:hypothetical protein
MSNEYNEGDLVEAVKGETRMSGRLADALMGDLGIDGMGWPIRSLEREGFTITVIEKAKPKVVPPTDVGFYLSRESKLWTLEVNGYWRDDYDYTRRPDEAEAHAPFTRLEPRAVTAKAVLDRLAVAIANNSLDEGTHDELRESLAAVIAEIVDEFGVTS